MSYAEDMGYDAYDLEDLNYLRKTTKKNKMSQIIGLSVDFNKLKQLAKVQGKNGAEYINLTVIINDTKDQYGNDASVIVSQTKEERAAKDKKTFVGNGKILFNSNNAF